MLGLSSVIACTTAKLIRVDAPHSLVPGLRRIRDPESSLRGCEDTEQGSRSDSDLYTLRFESYRFQGISSHITAVQATGTRSNARVRPAVPSARS